MLTFDHIAFEASKTAVYLEDCHVFWLCRARSQPPIPPSRVCVLMMYSCQEKLYPIVNNYIFHSENKYFKLLKCFVSLSFASFKEHDFLHNINMMALTNFNYSKAMLF